MPCAGPSRSLAGVVWARRSAYASLLKRSAAWTPLRTWPVMDELDRLVNVYYGRESSSVKSRLDVLMDLERIRDPRVVPFLLRVLRNADESDDVRAHVIRQLRTDTGIL